MYWWFCSTNISWDGEGEGVNEGWVSSDLFSYLGLEQWFGEGRGTRPPPPARGGLGWFGDFDGGGGGREMEGGSDSWGNRGGRGEPFREGSAI